MKHIVETTGDFMLLDPETRAQVPFNRPAVVKSNNFIEGRVALGQLKLVAANIGDGANDEDFAEFWNEKPEMAVDSYLSTLSVEVEISEELMAEMVAAVELLKEGDFQKDGKPKVGPLKALVEGADVDSNLRDTFWEAFNADDQG